MTIRISVVEDALGTTTRAITGPAGRGVTLITTNEVGDIVVTYSDGTSNTFASLAPFLTAAESSATNAENSAVAAAASVASITAQGTLAADAATQTAADVISSAAAQVAAEVAQSIAETKATEATTAQTNAAAARDAVQGVATQTASDLAAIAAIFDSFDDRYLGSKASDPLTDNDGDPLQTGAVYWNSVEGETRFYHSGNWERPSATAATSAQQAVDAKLAALAAQAAAETAQAAAEAAQGGAETAQVSAVAARDDAAGHATAASLASNASEWVSEGAYVYGQNVWSPLDFLTYRAKTAHSGSTTDPSLDEVNFAPASGGGSGGGGAQFAQFEVNPAGELILSFYDPAGAVDAVDFSINAAGELLLEIGL